LIAVAIATAICVA